LFVALNWPQITLVARALADKGIMSSTDIERLLKEGAA
jgi:hypothetical protein